MSREELKPCPFCGGEAEFERLGDRRQSCIVSCTHCGARHESSDVDDHNGSSWNGRATPDREMLKRFMEHYDKRVNQFLCGDETVEPNDDKYLDEFLTLESQRGEK